MLLDDHGLAFFLQIVMDAILRCVKKVPYKRCLHNPIPFPYLDLGLVLGQGPPNYKSLEKHHRLFRVLELDPAISVRTDRSEGEVMSLSAMPIQHLFICIIEVSYFCYMWCSPYDHAILH